MVERYRYNPDGLELLAIAIVKQAAVDYQAAVRGLRRNPGNWFFRWEKEKLERFFRSRYFGVLSGMDPELLMERLEREAENQYAFNDDADYITRL